MQCKRRAGLDALMRLLWVSELRTETSEAPEAMLLAEEMRRLMDLPEHLDAVPWPTPSPGPTRA